MTVSLLKQGLPIGAIAAVVLGWVWITERFVTQASAAQMHTQFVSNSTLRDEYLSRKDWELAYIDLQLTLTSNELRYWEGIEVKTQADQRQYDLLKIAEETLTSERKQRIGR